MRHPRLVDKDVACGASALAATRGLHGPAIAQNLHERIANVAFNLDFDSTVFDDSDFHHQFSPKSCQTDRICEPYGQQRVIDGIPLFFHAISRNSWPFGHMASRNVTPVEFGLDNMVSIFITNLTWR
jgi:hypothetical protein